jgi:hypothetical protein
MEVICHDTKRPHIQPTQPLIHPHVLNKSVPLYIPKYMLPVDYSGRAMIRGTIHRFRIQKSRLPHANITVLKIN